MSATTLDPGRSLTSHEAVAARFADVDPVYATTRDIRLLGFVLFLVSDCVFFSSFIFAYLYLRTGGSGLAAVRRRKAAPVPRRDLRGGVLSR